MITIFNRKELISLFSEQKLYAVGSALDTAGISYHTKLDVSMGRIGRRGRYHPLQNPDAAYQYKIYVHRDDYHHAVDAIQATLRNWNR